MSNGMSNGELHTKALKVVSLLPSATELIAIVLDLAPPGSAVLVGRSHECDFPPSLVNGLPMLTSSRIKFTSSSDVDRQVREQLDAGDGLYAVDEDLLRKLAPDVICTQSLCKVCSVDFCRVEKIAANLTPIPKVVDTNPMSLNDVLRDVCRVADALGQTQAGKRASKALQARIDAAVGLAAQCTRGGATAPKKVAFLEWTDPIFVGGHWTPQLIEMAGGLHPLNPCSGPGHGAGNSHTVTHDEFIASDPDIIIVAPCGLDLAATKRELAPLAAQPWWATMRAVTSRSVHVVDGNQMFNRPGPRLVEALEWLVSILHDVPDMKPKDFPAELL